MQICPKFITIFFHGFQTGDTEHYTHYTYERIRMSPWGQVDVFASVLRNFNSHLAFTEIMSEMTSHPKPSYRSVHKVEL